MSCHECCHFAEINLRDVCIQMQLVETTIKKLMQAPSSCNNQQVLKWKFQPPKHQMQASYHKRHNSNVQHIQNQEQEDCFQYIQVTTSTHNKQQACKQRSDNDTRRSHCQEPTQGIMSSTTAMTSTKSRIRLFSQDTNAHNKQQPTSTKVPDDLTAKNQHKA